MSRSEKSVLICLGDSSISVAWNFALSKYVLMDSRQTPRARASYESFADALEAAHVAAAYIVKSCDIT
jgi:hypothetical protein